jgi:hypothetical protein
MLHNIGNQVPRNDQSYLLESTIGKSPFIKKTDTKAQRKVCKKIQDKERERITNKICKQVL